MTGTAAMHHASLLLLLPHLAGALLMFPQVEFRDECMKAMCEAESGCLPEGCAPDSAGRIGCGYFRINIYQYKQCYQPGKLVHEPEEDAWERCAEDYNCSQMCVQRLSNRFKLKCYGKGDCETTARIKQGGANGCRTGETLAYWHKVKERCSNCR